MSNEKRPRGRPRVDRKAEFKSVSIPKDLWDECSRIATVHGTTVGKVAVNRILNGLYDPLQDEEKKEPDDGYEF